MRLSSERAWAAARALVAASAGLVISAGLTAARAQDFVPGIMAPGDAVVTNFSGVTPPSPPPAAGIDPLDETFIDLNGASMRILRLQPSGLPAGQQIPAPTIFSAKAGQVGQVFAITFDDAPAPDIYLGATSAFGLNIVTPDSDGDGRPERVKTGQPGATFMSGQWGDGGGPGSIYRVDGTTGEVRLLTTLGADNGPGIVDLVFDKVSRQFFVSDLDTGLIYRLDESGAIIDTFDHGVDGRPAHGLAPVADDGSAMDIADPSFNSEDPATWGFTQKERRVGALTIHNGRLYYAVNDATPSVWSIGIGLDGSFAGDPRWEFDVTGLKSASAVTDMLFDPQGRIVLAQRGDPVGSYDYSVLATPEQSSVARFMREIPDDPATPGAWVPTPDTYAIGFRPDGSNATGGISLGYGYESHGWVRTNSCGQFLWSTGDSLRDNPAMPELAAGGELIIHGLQGNDASLVRPQNDPPTQSYFADADGVTGDDANQGHVGDVEVYAPCEGGYTYYPPPPPPGFPPPPPFKFNLTLEKTATPQSCVQGGQGWICSYTVRVRNTGTIGFSGPITVNDFLPANPPGAIVTFTPQPPWTCGNPAPGQFTCTFPPVILMPGDAIDLFVKVDMKAAAPPAVEVCNLTNVAQIQWPLGFGDSNPSDDTATADAKVPGKDCKPPIGKQTDLKLEKAATPQSCTLNGGNWECQYTVTITNLGPGAETQPLHVTETIGTATLIAFNAPWSCLPAGPGTASCTLPASPFNPGDTRTLVIKLSTPAAALMAANKCLVENKAEIASPVPGSPQNTGVGNDSATVSAKALGQNCDPGKSDLSLKKEAFNCSDVGPVWLCVYKITIKNEGPADFNGPLELSEVVDPPMPSTSEPSIVGWNCNPAGPIEDCKLAGPTFIAAGGTFAASAVTTVDKSLIALCKVKNTASILAPGAGSAANQFGGNDTGSDIDTIPSAICQPVPPNPTDLAIEKKAVGPCTLTGDTVGCDFTIRVINTSPNEYKGPIAILDQAALPSQLTISPDDPAWTCNAAANQAFCFLPTADLAGGGLATFKLHENATLAGVQGAGCSVKDTAGINLPIVGPTNTNNANDVANATATLPANLCSNAPTPTNIVVTKTAGSCSKAASGWNCDYTIRFTNAGPGPFGSPIEVSETVPVGTTFAGAGLNPGDTCTPAGNGATCTFSPGKVLNPGEFFEMKVVLNAADALAYNPATCKIDNTVTITKPVNNPLNTSNADDKAVATASLPCNPVNLKITKTPLPQPQSGIDCAPIGSDWVCFYRVEVTNTGPGISTVPIKVIDISPFYTNPSFDIGQDMSQFECPVAGEPNACVFKGKLNPGESFHYTAGLKVPGSMAVPGACKIVNTAIIIDPVNSGFNSFAGDDKADGLEKIPMVPLEIPPFGTILIPCDPPSLSIAKTADPNGCSKVAGGFNCGFDIAVTSTGTAQGPNDPYINDILVTEHAPAGSKIISWSAPWTCVGTDDQKQCTYPKSAFAVDPALGVGSLPVGQSVALHIVVQAPDAFARANKCTVVNTADVTVPPEILKTPDGAKYSASASESLNSPLCGKIINACPAIRVIPKSAGGGCCPEGQKWDGKSACIGVNTPAPCPVPGTTRVDGVCVCADGLPPARNLAVSKTGLTCNRTKIDTTPSCPVGQTYSKSLKACICNTTGKKPSGNPPSCRVITIPTCPVGAKFTKLGCICDSTNEPPTGNPPRCKVVETPTCPSGARYNTRLGQCICTRTNEPPTGNPPSCNFVIKLPCWPHSSGNFPLCKCDTGYYQKGLQCLPVETPKTDTPKTNNNTKTNNTGIILKNPNILVVPKTCDNGGTPPDCLPPIR